ncbi:hypothetical protein ES703_94495 [subsurface metagenome]
MRLLTPELYCISALQVTSVAGHAIATRQLDFNLSRRSAIIINQLQSSWVFADSLGVSANFVTQECDLDPDNVDVWQGHSTPVAVEYDSSRVLRHVEGGITNVVTDNTFSLVKNQILLKKWHDVELERRPMSITAMRHHLAVDSNVAASVVDGQLMIWYHIAELTLEELGILNASRR